MKRLSVLASAMAIATISLTATATTACVFSSKGQANEGAATTKLTSFWHNMSLFKSDYKAIAAIAGVAGLAAAGGAYAYRRMAISTQHPEAPGGSLDLNDDIITENTAIEAEQPTESEVVAVK
ncbi:MAG: hypothetical protein P5702_17430 [Limnospira sp. PMC 1291.21]|uniref:Lipoprotein n=3 Tax=Limnospira TaxID=2596745 RepID=A0A9P1KCA8_9CYAN|nr:MULTISPECIES: hypothetical protein [Limnospira]EKD10084.1 hypothetical protein SPLC1_S101140 [Arthrospira platensis C1]MDC0840448.1 hypothetical protein [Limnoraphis robusta]QJB28509.1 hypothetical protein HFV01_25310 [Limnospira fusiformis SAG 85.79]EDZ95486.1 hypothetical protein AmaxDRAFT_1756 [Limnospira maxima CS-328]MDT9179305.1 hypothetical protein [Limnospira sp. PMC 1238.20]